MIGAGTFINPLLKVVTTVAILAATYFLLVRPILDTTETTIDRAFDSVNPALENTQQQINRATRRQGVQNFKIPASSQQSLEQANKLLDCITKAQGDVAEIQACNNK